MKKVLEAAGAKIDEAQVKAVVSNLKNVNIEDAIKQAAAVQTAPAQPQEPGEKKEEKKEEEKKEEAKTEEAVAGLGALFG